MSKDQNPWLEAAKLIAVDRHARVMCPRCGQAELVVTDTVLDNEGLRERHMRCPSCGGYNAMRIRRPDEVPGG